jgi:hypothetical protein
LGGAPAAHRPNPLPRRPSKVHHTRDNGAALRPIRRKYMIGYGHTHLARNSLIPHLFKGTI